MYSYADVKDANNADMSQEEAEGTDIDWDTKSLVDDESDADISQGEAGGADMDWMQRLCWMTGHVSWVSREYGSSVSPVNSCIYLQLRDLLSSSIDPS